MDSYHYQNETHDFYSVVGEISVRTQQKAGFSFDLVRVDWHSSDSYYSQGRSKLMKSGTAILGGSDRS